MAGDIATAYVRIRPNVSSFKAETETGVTSAFSDIGKKLTEALGLAFAGKTALDFTKSIVTSAADLQKQIEVIKEEFGGAQEAVLAFGKSAASEFGISTQLADQTSAKFGVLFKSLGVGADQAAKMTVGFEQLAGSIATIRNIDPSTLLGEIPLAAAGNIRALRALGVSLDATQIKNEALNLGLIQLGDTLTPQARAIAIYTLATAQLPRDLALAASHSGDLADRMAALNAEWANAKTQLGEQLLPTFVKFANLLIKDLPGAMKEFTADAKSVSSVVGTVTGALGGLVQTLKALGIAFVVVKTVKAFTTAWEGLVAAGKKAAGASTTAGQQMISENQRVAASVGQIAVAHEETAKVAVGSAAEITAAHERATGAIVATTAKSASTLQGVSAEAKGQIDALGPAAEGASTTVVAAADKMATGVAAVGVEATKSISQIDAASASIVTAFTAVGGAVSTAATRIVAAADLITAALARVGPAGAGIGPEIAAGLQGPVDMFNEVAANADLMRTSVVKAADDTAVSLGSVGAASSEGAVVFKTNADQIIASVQEVAAAQEDAAASAAASANSVLPTITGMQAQIAAGSDALKENAAAVTGSFGQITAGAGEVEAALATMVTAVQGGADQIATAFQVITTAAAETQAAIVSLVDVAQGGAFSGIATASADAEAALLKIGTAARAAATEVTASFQAAEGAVAGIAEIADSTFGQLSADVAATVEEFATLGLTARATAAEVSTANETAAASFAQIQVAANTVAAQLAAAGSQAAEGIGVVGAAATDVGSEVSTAALQASASLAGIGTSTTDMATVVTAGIDTASAAVDALSIRIEGAIARINAAAASAAAPLRTVNTAAEGGAGAAAAGAGSTADSFAGVASSAEAVRVTTAAMTADIQAASAGIGAFAEEIRVAAATAVASLDAVGPAAGTMAAEVGTASTAAAASLAKISTAGAEVVSSIKLDVAQIEGAVGGIAEIGDSTFAQLVESVAVVSEKFATLGLSARGTAAEIATANGTAAASFAAIGEGANAAAAEVALAMTRVKAEIASVGPASSTIGADITSSVGIADEQLSTIGTTAAAGVGQIQTAAANAAAAFETIGVAAEAMSAQVVAAAATAAAGIDPLIAKVVAAKAELATLNPIASVAPMLAPLTLGAKTAESAAKDAEASLGGVIPVAGQVGSELEQVGSKASGAAFAVRGLGLGLRALGPQIAIFAGIELLLNHKAVTNFIESITKGMSSASVALRAYETAAKGAGESLLAIPLAKQKIDQDKIAVQDATTALAGAAKGTMTWALAQDALRVAVAQQQQDLLNYNNLIHQHGAALVAQRRDIALVAKDLVSAQGFGSQAQAAVVQNYAAAIQKVSDAYASMNTVAGRTTSEQITKIGQLALQLGHFPTNKQLHLLLPDADINKLKQEISLGLRGQGFETPLQFTNLKKAAEDGKTVLGELDDLLKKTAADMAATGNAGDFLEAHNAALLRAFIEQAHRQPTALEFKVITHNEDVTAQLQDLAAKLPAEDGPILAAAAQVLGIDISTGMAQGMLDGATASIGKAAEAGTVLVNAAAVAAKKVLDRYEANQKSAIQTTNDNIDQAQQQLTQDIANRALDTINAVNQAKQNLVQIAASIGTEISNIFDKPLQNMQNKMNVAASKLNFQQLLQQGTAGGGAPLDPKKFDAQLTALERREPAFAQQIQAYKVQLDAAWISWQQAKNAIKSQSATLILTNLASDLNNHRISLTQFRERVTAELKKLHLPTKDLAGLMGKEFVDEFNGNVSGLFKQAGKITTGPQRPGSGQGPSIVDPAKTWRDATLSIQREQNSIGKDQRHLQTQIRNATAQTAKDIHAVTKAGGKVTSKEKNPGYGGSANKVGKGRN